MVVPFFFIFENILVITPPPEKLLLPSSTRPPAASRCRHVPSAQQHYDVPAKERASVPHLGEGEAWKSPSRGRLACPPPLFLSSLPAFFFFRPPTVVDFRIYFWPLEPWTQDDKRACVNSKHNNTRTNHSSVQPSSLAVRRIGNASAFRLAPGVAENAKQLQIPPSPRAL